ncbi:type 4 pilus major pilin [Limnobacter sp.]|uniref:type 4 pilus major pilin n=1 Tax=Limnobacter sp. TaxID=2003368 RepID=UPI0037484BB7
MMTSHTLNARRKQSGITLIEVSIGLIIAAIIAAAAFIAFQNNQRRNEVQDNIKQLTEVITETKQKVGITTGYAGFTEANAIQLAILEASAVATVPAKNSYSGAGEITMTGAADGETVTLTWPDVPSNQCADISLSVSGQVQSVNGQDTVNGSLPVASLDEVCVGDTTTLSFVFARR